MSTKSGESQIASRCATCKGSRPVPFVALNPTDAVHVEWRDLNRIPDVAVVRGNVPVAAFEIHAQHAVPPEKWNDFRIRGRHVMELDAQVLLPRGAREPWDGRQPIRPRALLPAPGPGECRACVTNRERVAGDAHRVVSEGLAKLVSAGDRLVLRGPCPRCEHKGNSPGPVFEPGSELTAGAVADGEIVLRMETGECIVFVLDSEERPFRRELWKRQTDSPAIAIRVPIEHVVAVETHPAWLPPAPLPALAVHRWTYEVDCPNCERRSPGWAKRSRLRRRSRVPAPSPRQVLSFAHVELLFPNGRRERHRIVIDGFPHQQGWDAVRVTVSLLTDGVADSAGQRTLAVPGAAMTREMAVAASRQALSEWWARARSGATHTITDRRLETPPVSVKECTEPMSHDADWWWSGTEVRWIRARIETDAGPLSAGRATTCNVEQFAGAGLQRVVRLSGEVDRANSESVMGGDQLEFPLRKP